MERRNNALICNLIHPTRMGVCGYEGGRIDLGRDGNR